MLIQDYLDICDPVLTFDRFMGEIELEKYLKNILQHDTGRLRYDPVSMLKTVLFGFMANGYISLRELEDQCKVNLRFMYLMDHQAPSYRTFGYFINEVLADSIEEIFQDINKKIFETEHVDLQHLYIDGSKFEANANKYSWVWRNRSWVVMGFNLHQNLNWFLVIAIAMSYRIREETTSHRTFHYRSIIFIST